jgi:hypothetical protein
MMVDSQGEGVSTVLGLSGAIVWRGHAAFYTLGRRAKKCEVLESCMC